MASSTISCIIKEIIEPVFSLSTIQPQDLNLFFPSGFEVEDFPEHENYDNEKFSDALYRVGLCLKYTPNLPQDLARKCVLVHDRLIIPLKNIVRANQDITKQLYKKILLRFA